MKTGSPFKKTKTEEQQDFLTSKEKTNVAEKLQIMYTAQRIGAGITVETIADLLLAVRKTKQKRKAAVALSFIPNQEQLMWILDEIKPDLSSGAKRTITSLQKVFTSDPTTDNLSDLESNSSS